MQNTENNQKRGGKCTQRRKKRRGKKRVKKEEKKARKRVENEGKMEEKRLGWQPRGRRGFEGESTRVFKNKFQMPGQRLRQVLCTRATCRAKGCWDGAFIY